MTVPEVSGERRSFKDVNFNHKHRRHLRCWNGNFAEPIQQQKVYTASPHPWNFLVLPSFKWKHVGITKICRNNGGAQTSSPEYTTTSWASGPLLCPLDCRKTAQQNTKVLGVLFKGKRTADRNYSQELKTILEECVQALESAAPSNNSSNTKNRSHSQKNQAQRQFHFHVTTTNQQCECWEE